MSRQKRLQDLTIKDNFMFGAVMSIEENGIAFPERVLGFPIEKVVITKERSMIYHPKYKGVRLDIYAKDENRTHYNVEMQARRQALGSGLPKSVRQDGRSSALPLRAGEGDCGKGFNIL